MIVLDTSLLIDALTGPRRSGSGLRQAISAGERIVLPTIVLYEWLRGPRNPEEIAVQEALFPLASTLPFGVEEAEISARLYRSVKRPRGREIDLAIAASAIAWTAPLWTLNPADFGDVPGIQLYKAR